MKPTGKELPDTAYLHERLTLSDEGVLYWKKREGEGRAINSWNTKHGDKVAGSLDHKGYVVVSLDGSIYKAHRIIYAMVNGACPSHLDIDHIDMDSRNNAPDNLRAVTPEFNGARQRNGWGDRGIHAREQYRSSVGRCRH